MKSVLIGIVVSTVAVMFASVRVATPATPLDRPAEISADKWLPIGENIGIVLVSGDSLVDVPKGAVDIARPGSVSISGLKMVSPTKGYFMIKVGGRWTRLYLSEP